ncbi:FAD binding domain-containing protein [Phlyctema vagabunda]|uniref:FAD binding domain-containing protein n=1 Tax=Phlyctema vagabunda TaxID=108571 RepID=A0ABR4PTT3_9HELO
MKLLNLALSASALLASQFTLSSAAAVAKCRCLPGDACWPTAATWKTLNSTVGGRLVATVPLGKPCHDPSYNAAQCTALQNGWLNPSLHMESSSSVMAPFFANQSCDPFQPQSRACTLGNYVNYAVNVSTTDDVIAAVNFAQKYNIRFVIRNTGHDYLGKSTGAGALSVWTHHLKKIEFLDWSDSNYKGKAMRVGAGVQGFDALTASKAQGLVTVGGECSTVGVAGGYTQGGGHSALSTNFGLGADNTLSFDVVTANGCLVTASRTQNADLYWALSGGGGGTYGVVVSMTAKAHPDTIVGGAMLVFYPTDTTADIFYQAIDKFHALLPAMVDAGTMVVYYFTNAFFQIAPITAYGKTAEQTVAVLSSFTAVLDSLNITYSLTSTTSATYYDHYNTYFGPLPYGNINVGIAQYGGRLISRDNVASNLPALAKAYRSITEDGVTFIGVGTNVSSTAITQGVSNAVLPAWRTALVHATLTLPWDFTAPWSDMIALQDKMTNSIVPQMEAVTPNSGTYMNEADFRQPGFKEKFFGANYNKLLAIKNKYDPNHLFYAVTAVGSDAWTVAKDGRMCRA